MMLPFPFGSAAVLDYLLSFLLEASVLAPGSSVPPGGTKLPFLYGKRWVSKGSFCLAMTGAHH